MIVHRQASIEYLLSALWALRLQHHKIIENDIHTRFAEGASQQADITRWEGRILYLRHLETIHIKSEGAACAIGAKVIYCYTFIDIGR